jgi:hypothetical protein
MAKLRVKEVAKEKGISMGKLSRAADVDMNALIKQKPAHNTQQ